MAEQSVTVTVDLDRQPTIEDIQNALNTLRAEGIPDSFEVDVISAEEREYDAGVPYDERRVVHIFRMSASRAAKSA